MDKAKEMSDVDDRRPVREIRKQEETASKIDIEELRRLATAAKARRRLPGEEYTPSEHAAYANAVADPSTVLALLDELAVLRLLAAAFEAAWSGEAAALGDEMIRLAETFGRNRTVLMSALNCGLGIKEAVAARDNSEEAIRTAVTALVVRARRNEALAAVDASDAGSAGREKGGGGGSTILYKCSGASVPNWPALEREALEAAERGCEAITTRGYWWLQVLQTYGFVEMTQTEDWVLTDKGRARLAELRGTAD